MFKVYEIDYHERAYFVGSADTLSEARKIARKALKKSDGEFPCFVMHNGECVADIR